MQQTLDFTSTAPINREHLTRQNRMLFQHLSEGRTITAKQAFEDYGISRLSGRIFELRKLTTVFDRFTEVDGVKFKEYSLTQF